MVPHALSSTYSDGSSQILWENGERVFHRDWRLDDDGIGGNLMRASDLDASIDKEFGRFKGAVSRLTSRWLAQFAVTRFAKRYDP